jgi:hypothetical protein
VNVNGGSYVSLNGRTGSTFKETTGNEGYSQLGIGALSHKGRFPLDGAIGEMIFIPSALDLETRHKIEGYLAHKWGLTSNLPSYHPYKNIAPEVSSKQTWSPTLEKSDGTKVEDDYSFGFKNCLERDGVTPTGRQFDCEFAVSNKLDGSGEEESMLTLKRDSDNTSVLTVGKVKTKKWEIPTPDYVFEEGYELPSLSSVESYIQKNGHLPEIPSAVVMEQEGIDLATMNMRLLKKIEEMTLHMIRLEKEVESLKNQDLR